MNINWSCSNGSLGALYIQHTYIDVLFKQLTSVTSYNRPTHWQTSLLSICRWAVLCSPLNVNMCWLIDLHVWWHRAVIDKDVFSGRPMTSIGSSYVSERTTVLDPLEGQTKQHAQGVWPLTCQTTAETSITWREKSVMMKLREKERQETASYKLCPSK